MWPSRYAYGHPSPDHVQGSDFLIGRLPLKIAIQAVARTVPERDYLQWRFRMVSETITAMSRPTVKEACSQVVAPLIQSFDQAATSMKSATSALFT